jgi:hypothetical protein
MSQSLLELYHRHIGMAFDRQLRFADLCRERGIDPSWNYTVSTAELTLGGRAVYVAPLLGSHAEAENTWLWAWGNAHLNLPTVGRELAGSVRALATATGCAAFAQSDAVDCEAAFGDEQSEYTAHAMGAILSGLLGYDAYYTIPYTGGRAAALFRAPDLFGFGPPPLLALTSRFTQLVSAMPVPDHRAAFSGYAADLGVTLSSAGSVVTGNLAGEGSVTAEFDHLNRLSEMKSTLNPSN